MVALGWPAIDLVFTGGRFSAADARVCSLYFAIFSVSMFLWSAQAIYARAFYAAGNTFAPMVASTIVTVVSLPIYYSLFHWRGATGLALASDAASLCRPSPLRCFCISGAWSRSPSLDYVEMGRCMLAALTAGAATGLLAWGLADLSRHLPVLAALRHSRDAVILAAGIAVWIFIVKWILEKSGSALPRVALRRLGLG